jgi:hypothetical protein
VTVGRLALVASISALAALVTARDARAAHDPFAWAPPGPSAVERGRQAASRFGLRTLHEVTVEVDNLFAAANRQALSLAEQRLREVPGVRGVVGPSGLLDISIDANGTTSARKVLARGESESEGEAARQRVVRRADAVGWFVTENGRRVRFFVDAEDWGAVASGVAKALSGSGLGLAPTVAGPLEARPLWPDPRHRSRVLPIAIVAVWVALALIAIGRAHLGPSRGLGWRRVALALAAALGAAAPFVLVPVTGIRVLGGLGALAAATLVVLAGFAMRKKRPAPAAAGGAVTSRRPSAGLAVFALATVVAGISLAVELRIGTRQWIAAPTFFVDVRADLDSPVVLREIRRVTDFLRDQPGVANAWSVADLFLGVTSEGEEASRIPDDPEQVRRVLVQARTDPAVRLELGGDHRQALIGIRFDNDPTVDHLAIVAALQRYIDVELRRSLLFVDLSAAGTPPETRSLGRGMLAVDARDRVLRMCARSGRPLDPAESLSVERVTRQAATIPVADPARLEMAISETVRDFVTRHPFRLQQAETARLVAAVGAIGDAGGSGEVRVALAAAYGARMPDVILRASADTLARRVAAVRRRHVARTNFRDMLYGAQLPTEGVLADEVRSATLEAMGPIVGIPAATDNPAALKLDLVPVGGAPNDRALSQRWKRGLAVGVAAAAGLLAILLVVVGGAAGLLSLPLGLAPLAAAVAPAALLGEPVGLPTISFYAGALAAGAILAMAVASSRNGNGHARGSV